MRKLTALGLAVMVLACLFLSGCQSQTVDARDSVAVVYSSFDDKNYGSIDWGHGTGFFVGEKGKAPKYLITNYHVISEYVDFGSGELVNETTLINDKVMELYGRSKIRVYFDSQDYEEAFLVTGDEAKDVAILKLASETTKRIPLALRVAEESDVGKPIQIVGYPGLADNILTDSLTLYGKQDATVTTGSISRLFTTAGTGRDEIQVDCEIRPGNSGGPILDESGATLGIATHSVMMKDGSVSAIHYAISISEAIPMLKQYSIPFTMAKSTIDTTLVLVIAAAVIVVALVVLLVVLLTRKKPARKKSTRVPDPVPVVPPTMRRPVVRSMASVNAGTMAEVRGKLVIGRSSACGLQFPEGTPGVSGNHCVVEYDAVTGDFIVTDIGSSYGTFVNGGEKLVPHVSRRLLPRDRISLGNMDNVVIVDLVEV